MKVILNFKVGAQKIKFCYDQVPVNDFVAGTELGAGDIQANQGR